MARITKIMIKNFQSHENTELELDKGLNVIIGPSDQGKSAILRAIKWVLFNEPRGMDFIMHGKAAVKVALELSNGYTIIRERSRSKNRYLVEKPDGSEIILEGFGNDVPEEVVKAHNIKKVLLDNDFDISLNIGEQLEGPFLLSQPGAIRAKAIGRLTGLHIIDKTIRDCISDIKRESASADRLREQFSDLDRNLDKYRDLDTVEETLDSCRDLLDRADHKEASRRKLVELKVQIVSTEKELGILKKKLADLKFLDKIETHLTECIKKYKNLKNLMSIKDRWVKLKKEIEEADNIKKKTDQTDILFNMIEIITDKIRLRNKLSDFADKLLQWDSQLVYTNKLLNETRFTVDLKESIDSIAERIISYRKLNSYKERSNALIEQIAVEEEFLEKNLLYLRNLTDEYIGALKSAGKCPLCGSKLSEKKLKGIITHYKEDI